MEIPSAEQIFKAMAHRGHAIYDTPEGHNLNIIGIRTASTTPNRFDDLLTVVWRRGTQLCYWFAPATTDPGLYWLEHPENTAGCAILKEGQYPGAFTIGRHQGKYEALVQRGPLTVIRDTSKDAVIDLNSGIEQSGLFGINIHCAAWQGESRQVDRWSAGCQVFANWHDFQVFMALCRAGASQWGNSFSYTLLHQRDFGVIA